MPTRDPLVSIVMPVFNAGDYLLPALASLLEQSFQDWEMICVDDGSQDKSGHILDWFASVDSRIRVIHQSNTGIVGALNRGCSAACAPLICRMDCDDIALPNRLEAQVAYLRQHPECTVVGGAILEMDGEGDPLRVSRLPTQHADIVDGLLHRRTGHFHPTTMFRAEAFEAVGGYRAKYQWVEDHDLWLRMAQRGRLANLEDVLLCYRQHASSVCWQRSGQQRQLMNELLQEAYRARGRELPAALLAETTVNRSAAGPGKWARAAAKGGYPRSAFKHLRRLMDSDATRGYKIRMIAEVIARLVVDVPRRICSRSTPTIPTFPLWHERLSREFKPTSQTNWQESAA
ncbi:MAG: glycosyltransferase [Pirellulaceae bacterium]